MGSAAAPTASLNMTEDLLARLEKKGVIIKYLTLHVGLGTFLPIRSDKVEDHHMHSEWYHIPEDTIRAIEAVKKALSRSIFGDGPNTERPSPVTTAVGAEQTESLLSVLRRRPADDSLSTGARERSEKDAFSPLRPRVIALGTTVARTLEYYARTGKAEGEDDIFIYPGFEFQIVDALITNFHAPKSTVLMLASAFAGWDNLHNAYNHAVAEKYNFLSYGDSMLIHSK